MSTQFNPYITFNGNCDEAMSFYAAVLGGEPKSMTFRQAGMDVDGVMHSALETPDGYHLYASDFAEGMGAYDYGTNVQVSLSGDEADKLRGFFDGLAEGGQVTVPLQKQMWGDEYGQLVDRFGIVWHCNIAGEQA